MTTSMHLRGLILATIAALAGIAGRADGFSWLEVDAERVQRGQLAGYRDPISLAVSPDGRHVYGSDHTYPGALAVFDRDLVTGRLDFAQLVPGWDYSTPVTWPVPLLSTALAVAVAPDGAHVYVATYYGAAVSVFARDAGSGRLTFVHLVERLEGLGGASAIVFSPDGAHVYVSGYYDNAVAMFSRSPATGELTYLGAALDGAGGVVGLDEPVGLVMSPGGEHLYAAAAEGNAVVAFHRDGVTGVLSFLGTWRDGDPGIDRLDEPHVLALSPDGRHLYAASTVDDAITIFARDAVTGQLTPAGVYVDGVADLGTHSRQMLVTPDGRTVIASNLHGPDDPGLLFLDRDPATGLLTFRDDLAGGPVSATAWNLAMSPDGATLYAGLFETAVLALRAPTVACDPSPRPGCRPPLPGRARLALRDDPLGARRALKWQWQGGGTSFAAFGDPVGQAVDFAFCLYADGGSRLSAAARGGAQCLGRSCWKLSGSTRLTYADRAPSPAGLGGLKLQATATADAKLLATAKGPTLASPGLPFGAASLRAQLVSSTGECWDAAFSPPYNESKPDRFAESSD